MGKRRTGKRSKGEAENGQVLDIGPTTAMTQQSRQTAHAALSGAFALRCLFAVTRSGNYSLQAMQTLTLKLLAYSGHCRIRLSIPWVGTCTYLYYGGASDPIATVANVPAISRAMTFQGSSIVIYLPLVTQAIL